MKQILVNHSSLTIEDRQEIAAELLRDNNIYLAGCEPKMFKHEMDRIVKYWETGIMWKEHQDKIV